MNFLSGNSDVSCQSFEAQRFMSTQVEKCANDQTIKNAQGGGGGGGGGVKCVFDNMDDRHINVCLHERAS